MSGELTFTMREKRDRNGERYLVGQTPFIDAVLFVRPDPRREGMYHATLKPYTGPREEGPDAWITEALNDYDPSTKERP